MIDKALTFLRDQLNAYIQVKTGVNNVVEFINGNQFGTGALENNAVNLVMLNLEEERTMRTLRDVPQGCAPDVKMNVNVLFAARFSQYVRSLENLSWVIKFFQGSPVFTSSDQPTLDPEVQKLSMELLRLPVSETNGSWELSRLSYPPSVLYRARLLVLRDDSPVAAAPDITDIGSNATVNN